MSNKDRKARQVSISISLLNGVAPGRSRCGTVAAVLLRHPLPGGGLGTAVKAPHSTSFLPVVGKELACIYRPGCCRQSSSWKRGPQYYYILINSISSCRLGDAPAEYIAKLRVKKARTCNCLVPCQTYYTARFKEQRNEFGIQACSLVLPRLSQASNMDGGWGVTSSGSFP